MCDAFSDDLLKEFTYAFQQSDWAVAFGEAVILLSWLGDDHDCGRSPFLWVVTHAKACFKQVLKVVWGG
jgi:hypothetical protein